MSFLPMGRLLSKILYHRVRQVRVCVYTTIPAYPRVRNTRIKQPATLAILAHIAHEFGPNPTKHYF
jgi:hypothetical protein